MVVLVLPQTVDSVSHEATKSDKQCGRQCAVHRRCEFAELAFPGPSDDGNAEKSDGNTDEHRGGQLAESVLFGEERIDEHRSHDGAQSGTGAQGDRLSEGYAEVAHGQTEGKSAYSPKYSEKHSHGHMETVGTGQQLYKTMTGRHGQLSAQQR